MEMMMDTGHTAAQLRGDTPLPIYPRVEVWKYNLGEPLVRPDLVRSCQPKCSDYTNGTWKRQNKVERAHYKK